MVPDEKAPSRGSQQNLRVQGSVKQKSQQQISGIQKNKENSRPRSSPRSQLPANDDYKDQTSAQNIKNNKE